MNEVIRERQIAILEEILERLMRTDSPEPSHFDGFIHEGAQLLISDGDYGLWLLKLEPVGLVVGHV